MSNESLINYDFERNYDFGYHCRRLLDAIGRANHSMQTPQRLQGVQEAQGAPPGAPPHCRRVTIFFVGVGEASNLLLARD